MASGRGGGETNTPIASKILTPDEFSSECRRLVTTKSGHAAHRELDALVTGLLGSLGYSEGMAIFLAHVGNYHTGETS